MQKRIVKQHIAVLAVTVLLTVLSACVFSSIYLHIEHGTVREENVFLADGRVVATDLSVGTVEVREIEMCARLGEAYTFAGITYLPEAREYREGETVYTHLRLVPVARENGYFHGLILTTLAAFCSTFGFGLYFVWRWTGRECSAPLRRLSADLDRLVEGELTAEILPEGEAELRALFDKAEKLRLRLSKTADWAEKTDRERKFLISSISHDLKTPLAALAGYLEGLGDGVADTPEKQQLYLQKAAEKTKLLENMIGQLLLYARLDMQEVPIMPEETEILSFMKNAAEELQVAFPDVKVTLESSMEGGSKVRIDRTLFTRVVQNIGENAKKYGDKEEKHLWISLHQTDAAVILEFKDNGCGIEETDLPRVFDRFYRGDRARKSEGSGGLGLAIARQITESMGGRIWAASTKGEGTSIRLSLPIIRREA